jgi:hypothetical protein
VQTLAKYKTVIGIVVSIIIIITVIYILGRRSIKKQIPKDVELPSDTQAGGQTNFNPGPFTDAVYEDITEIIGTRDSVPYQNLLGLSNSQLVAVYNDWNQRYYSKVKQTLTQAIADEMTIWNYSWVTVAGTLIERLKGLNCN